MDHDYIVEIEYIAKKEIPIKALSKQWAEIIATEVWEEEYSEPITTIKVKDVNGY